jgi:hypothetical protein
MRELNRQAAEAPRNAKATSAILGALTPWR